MDRTRVTGELTEMEGDSTSQVKARRRHICVIFCGIVALPDASGVFWEGVVCKEENVNIPVGELTVSAWEAASLLRLSLHWQ